MAKFEIESIDIRRFTSERASAFVDKYGASDELTAFIQHFTVPNHIWHCPC